MRKLAVVLVALSVVAGCNTVRGAGQDIQRAGQTIEGAAQ
ncbi:entericidin A/B family lipoprotein [Meridianimarinicoccus sp. RP-17]|nr:entericidin A/B family lipoprotein [Phycocomes zhengii]